MVHAFRATVGPDGTEWQVPHAGGPTTDVIPIAGGAVAARGRTDLERLFAGELVYTGALRTNVAALLSHVPIGGQSCPVSDGPRMQRVLRPRH